MHPLNNGIADTVAGGIFRTTDWATVRKAAHASSPGNYTALGNICGWYWKSLYAFARRKGRTPEEAQDLTQGFFAVLLEKNYLSSACCDRGRFRTFLLAAFENFLRNDWTCRRTLKRGGSTTFVSLDFGDAEHSYQQEPADKHSPVTLFERKWAMSLLETVLERLRNEFLKAGRAEQFEALEPFLSSIKQPASYEDAAAKLKLSEAAVRVAVHRLRIRYGKLLRQAVAETLADPNDVDDELRHLLAALST